MQKSVHTSAAPGSQQSSVETTHEPISRWLGPKGDPHKGGMQPQKANRTGHMMAWGPENRKWERSQTQRLAGHGTGLQCPGQLGPDTEAG